MKQYLQGRYMAIGASIHLLEQHTQRLCSPTKLIANVLEDQRLRENEMFEA